MNTNKQKQTHSFQMYNQMILTESQKKQQQQQKHYF